ncbi:MAG: PNGase F N-terminal domain-containing protein [Candidatus Eisenbacteria bacterium]
MSLRIDRVLLAVLLGFITLSRAEGTTRVVYATTINGELQPDEGQIVLETAGNVAAVRTERLGTPIPGTPQETGFVDFSGGATLQLALLRDGSRAAVETRFGELPVLEEASGADTVLGHVCRHATTVVRSNHIDLWYTEDLGVAGTPAINFVKPGAVILKMVRNGNYIVEATRIEETPRAQIPTPALPADRGELVDLPTYRARVTESFVTTVRIFDREQISFGNEVVNPEESDSNAVFRYAGGTVIARRVSLPEMPDDAAVFAEVVQYSNGDAYDRTGSIFLMPVDRRVSFLDALRHGVDALPKSRDRAGRDYQGIAATEDYTPPVELVRFITPFGVRHYNGQVKVRGLSWEDSAVYKMEVSELLPLLRGPVWIGAFIGNYDKGGHRLSLALRYHPGSRTISDQPLARAWNGRPSFAHAQPDGDGPGQQYGRLFEDDTLRVDFDLPAGWKVLAFATSRPGTAAGTPGMNSNLR